MMDYWFEIAKALQEELREKNLEIEALGRKAEADRLQLQEANKRACNPSIPKTRLTKADLNFCIFLKLGSALRDIESSYNEHMKGDEFLRKVVRSTFKGIRRAFRRIQTDCRQLGNKGEGRTRATLTYFIFARVEKAFYDIESCCNQLFKGQKPHIVIGAIFESIRVKLREIDIHFLRYFDQSSEILPKLVEGGVQKDARNDLAKQKRERLQLLEAEEQYVDTKFKRCRV